MCTNRGIGCDDAPTKYRPTLPSGLSAVVMKMGVTTLPQHQPLHTHHPSSIRPHLASCQPSPALVSRRLPPHLASRESSCRSDTPCSVSCQASSREMITIEGRYGTLAQRRECNLQLQLDLAEDHAMVDACYTAVGGAGSALED